ncbi:MAG TPA: aspartate kinase [Anaerolineae bacterium]|nr:aspartate kinase [Anaerolineae bacterium]
MIVMKFGGTSVGDGEAIKRAAELVHGALQEGRQIVVVVSAMSGVTDALLSAATSAARGDGDTFRHTRWTLSDRHREAIADAISDEDTRLAIVEEVEGLLSDFENLCRSIHILGELTARGSDAVASLGERMAVRIVAAALRERGVQAQAVEATELIITNGQPFDRLRTQHGAASPLMEETRKAARARLLPLLADGVTPVVTGYIAATREGVTTTLGRGGSDYTAAILGACLEAEEVWIWTDVDGVMTADPRVVPEARTLPEISYAEAAELSYFGAKVLHPKTILPAVEQGIPLRILNTFNPTHPGTLIVADARPSHLTVKGITSIKGLSLITVEGRGMLGVPGIAARVFSAVAGEGISVLMISQSSSEQNICFVIRQEATRRALRALEAAFELELARRNVDRIWAQEGVAIVAAVGAGMKGTPGIAAKVFGALGKHGINVISIAQGSSEYNISFVVDEGDMEDAVRYIHEEFDLGRSEC